MFSMLCVHCCNIQILHCGRNKGNLSNIKRLKVVCVDQQSWNQTDRLELKLKTAQLHGRRLNVNTLLRKMVKWWGKRETGKRNRSTNRTSVACRVPVKIRHSRWFTCTGETRSATFLYQETNRFLLYFNYICHIWASVSSTNVFSTGCGWNIHGTHRGLTQATSVLLDIKRRLRSHTPIVKSQPLRTYLTGVTFSVTNNPNGWFWCHTDNDVPVTCNLQEVNAIVLKSSDDSSTPFGGSEYEYT